MKKTLMGVFAFVLVMVMVLTSSVYAMRSSDDVMTEAAKVKKVTEGAITVDGDMDDAYKDATPLYIDIPGEIPPEGLYTYAVARFVWSDEALYCFVIVNDMNVQCPDGKNPWEQDSVELFLDWNNTAKYDLSAAGISADKVLSRSFQYRISAKGRGTCYLLEESKTYEFDKTKKRFAVDGSKLITDDVNYFGWGEGDYAAKSTKLSGATTGYTVEFRIPHTGLKSGQEIGFDFQINEVYDYNTKTNKSSQMLLYYNSAKRGGQVSTVNTAQYYDWLTLSDDTAAEQNGNTVTLTELVNYGLANTNTQRATVTTTKTVAKTSRLTLNASRNTKKVTTKTTTTTATGGDSSNGGNTDNSGTSDTGSSGCGSSIAIGSSVAMISLVGVAGFFSFRRKKDDEE